MNCELCEMCGESCRLKCKYNNDYCEMCEMTICEDCTYNIIDPFGYKYGVCEMCMVIDTSDSYD